MYAKDDHHELEDGFFSTPALTDLNGDKKLDIVVCGMDARVYAWDGGGKAIAGFPVLVADPKLVDDPTSAQPQMRERIMASPAIGDLNKDGIPEIVVGTTENYDGNGRLYAIDGRGMGAPGGPFLPGWPASIISTRFLPMVAQGLPCSPAMVDLNGDKRPEIIISGLAAVLKAYDYTGKTFGPTMASTKAIDKMGRGYGPNSNAQNQVEFSFVAHPAVGDLDSDGTPDLVEGTAGVDIALAFASAGSRKDFEHHFSAWDGKSGNFKKGFPRVIEDWVFFSTPAVADVDGDGKPEVLSGSGGYFVHGWNVNGDEPKNFPKFTGGWALATPTVGDIDGDGKLELIATTRSGYLFAWHTEGKANGRIDWANFRHDNHNTGNFETLIDQGTRAQPGCNCDMMTGGAPSQAWLALLGLALTMVRRRRKR
jgi:MYXO-CTERM domain-containing protein